MFPILLVFLNYLFIYRRRHGASDVLLRPTQAQPLRLTKSVFYSECLEAVENHHRKHKKHQIQKNHHTGYVWSAGDTLARYRYCGTVGTTAVPYLR